MNPQSETQKHSALVISRSDFEKISELLSHQDSVNVEQLDEELGRAAIVPDAEVPEDVVTMESKVRFEDLSSGDESEVVLVYPEQADASKGRVSILAPIGSALIGLRVGQCIDWPLPRGNTKKIRVIAVEK